MASLMEVREYAGPAGPHGGETAQCSPADASALIDAMLERMEAMGKVVRISENERGLPLRQL
ncbi:Ferrous iron transport protein C [Serratia liquefaciens]|nr:Ferrous iron transport protein C [Serratia liquefaciens]